MVRFGRKGILILTVLCAFLMMAACGGGGGGSAGGPITVSGTVVDATNTGVSGANVVLNSDTASLVTTGATGTFSFSNVTPPYTLTVKSGTTIIEYRGLTRGNPLVTIDGGVGYGTTVAGNVTGATNPLPSGEAILLGATNGALISGLTESDGSYSKGIYWSGSSTKTIDLAALHLSFTGSLVTNFIATGARTGVNLEQGVSQTGLDIALSTPVAMSSTLFNYSFGAYTVGGKGGYFMLKANGAQFVAANATIASGTSVTLPSGGATLMVQGKDTDGNSVIRIRPAVLGGTTTLDLPASTALKNDLPADGATNLSTTPTLTWTPVSGAELYVVGLHATGLDYNFILPGGSASLAIPDYSVLGLPLAAGTTYDWDVTAVASSGLSVNSATDPALGGLNEFILYQASSIDFYTSASTTFTTAP
jgi:hypothetical protein